MYANRVVAVPGALKVVVTAKGCETALKISPARTAKAEAGQMSGGYWRNRTNARLQASKISRPRSNLRRIRIRPCDDGAETPYYR